MPKITMYDKEVHIPIEERLITELQFIIVHEVGSDDSIPTDEKWNTCKKLFKTFNVSEDIPDEDFKNIFQINY